MKHILELIVMAILFVVVVPVALWCRLLGVGFPPGLNDKRP